MLRKIAYKLGLKFKDPDLESSYKAFRMEIEKKLLNMANIFSVSLSLLNLLLGILGSGYGLVFRGVVLSIAILGAIANFKAPNASKVLLIIASISGFYIMMKALGALFDSCYPESYYFIGNAFGFAEIIFTLSIRSLRLRVAFTLISFIVKCIILRDGLFLKVILRGVGNTIVFLIYYLYSETLERRNYKIIYESREQLRKFKSLLSNDFPSGVIILSSDLKSVLYSNHFFKNEPGIDDDQNFILSVFENFHIETYSISLPLQTQRKYNLREFIRILSPNIALLPEKEVVTLSSTYISHLNDKNATDSTAYYEIKLRQINWDSQPSYALIFQDVSDKQLVMSLKIIDEHKDRVIATVSHELRTPINGILGLLEIISSRIVDKASQTYLDYCKSCSKLLLYLVNSILDLSQIRHNKLKIVKNYFHLNEVFDELRLLYSFQADQKNIEFKITRSKGLPNIVYSDKYRLIEILINLLGNAFKFTFKGQISLNVSQHAYNKDKLIFTVTDTGVGIKEEDKPKLFQVFGKLKQEDKNLNAHGAGLGLTIANELVGVLNEVQENEKLEFLSEYGKGTTFYFALSSSESPFSDKPSVENGEEAFERFLCDELEPDTEISMPYELLYPPLMPSKRNFTPKKESLMTKQYSLKWKISTIKNIIIVDDNPFNILVASFILEKLKCNVFKAMSGEECLEILSKRKETGQYYDLILMDVQMPIMDGLETSRIITSKIKEGLFYDIPIVALSANENSDHDINKYRESGIVDYLQKPLREEELEKVLLRWLNKK